jgi:hypothetical protein
MPATARESGHASSILIPAMNSTVLIPDSENQTGRVDVLGRSRKTAVHAANPIGLRFPKPEVNLARSGERIAAGLSNCQ